MWQFQRRKRAAESKRVLEDALDSWLLRPREVKYDALASPSAPSQESVSHAASHMGAYEIPASSPAAAIPAVLTPIVRDSDSPFVDSPSDRKGNLFTEPEIDDLSFVTIPERPF